MNENQQSFRERLLAAEKSTPTEKYQRDMNVLLERKITPIQRNVMAGVIALVSVSAIAMGGLAVIGPGNLPMMARYALVAGAIGSLLCVGIIVRVLKRGSIQRIKDPVFVNTLIWIFSSLAVAFALPLAGGMSHGVMGIYLILFMLYFFASASVLLVRSLLEQAELRTREKLLEVEYRLAQLSEQLLRK